MPEHVYDDRLTGHDDVDSLLDAAEEIVEELAEQHYEQCYSSGPVCIACNRDTPMSKEWGPWIGKARQVDKLIEAVEDRLEEMGEDSHWVMSDLSGYYIDQFHAASCDPGDCVVCTNEIVSEDDGCGHTMDGETCPVPE